MPRGLCENCGRHDVFVYPVPLAFGRTVFVCARCLNLPQAPVEDDEDQDDDWELRQHRHSCKGRIRHPQGFTMPRRPHIVSVPLIHCYCCAHAFWSRETSRHLEG
jgi:hypothetical protein